MKRVSTPEGNLEPSTLADVLQAFTARVSKGGLFLIFTLAAALATSGIADGVSELSSPWVTAIFGVLLIVLLFTPFFLQLFKKGDDVTINIDFGTDNETVPRRRGLITLVSKGALKDIPALNAIAYHANADSGSPVLSHLWLVCSEGEEEEPDSSYYNARKLADQFEASETNARSIKVKIVPVTRPNDPNEVFEATQDIYREAQAIHNLGPDDVIADITGGTKWMSIGLAYAGWPDYPYLQYMDAAEKDEKGRAKAGSTSVPRQIEVKFVPAILSSQNE